MKTRPGAIAIAAIVAATECAAAIGCASGRPRAKEPDPAWIVRRTDPLFDEPLDVPRLAKALAQYRGLALSEALHIERYGADRMNAEFAQPEWIRADADEFWHAFGLAPSDDAVTARLQPIRTAGVAGFYRACRKLLVVRDDPDKPESAHTQVLLHEIEHALQDQAGKLPVSGTGDELLAKRALVEGDADVTSTSFLLLHRHRWDHWLPWYLSRLHAMSRDESLFAGAPRFARRLWLFPYLEGSAFVGSMVRAGGYRLVDRVFEHPPVSTEQILHPDKYVAGELPVEVAPPAPPPGYRLVEGGTMGELRTRLLVEECDPNAAPGDEPLGWGGDAYVIAKGDGKGSALLWDTVWDDEAAAQRFEGWMASRDRCVARALRLPSGLPADATVSRRGDHVAYVRGLTPDARAAAVDALLATPYRRPAPAPWAADVHLRPLVDPDSFVGRGVVRDHTYVSPALGLTVPLHGFDVEDSAEGLEFTVEKSLPLSLVWLNVRVLMTSWDPALENFMLWHMVTPSSEAGTLPEYQGDRDLDDGHAMVWSGYGAPSVLVGFVPLCGGKMTLVVNGIAKGPGIFETATELVSRIRFDDDAPACVFAKEDVPPQVP